MGVVGVDADLIRETGKVAAISLFKVLHNVGYARSHKEILLFEPQSLTGFGAVIGIENAGDGLDLVALPAWRRNSRHG